MTKPKKTVEEELLSENQDYFYKDDQEEEDFEVEEWVLKANSTPLKRKKWC